MEQVWNPMENPLSVEDIPQTTVETAYFHSLGLIQRNCEYLEQHMKRTGADAAAQQAVLDISAQAVKLGRTMEETTTLLDLLRSQQPELGWIDLCELLRQVADQADGIRAQLGVELELDHGAILHCPVLAEAENVELILLHLLSNAMRACKPGCHITIRLERSGEQWVVTVQDDGCGLPGKNGENLLENRRAFLGSAGLGLKLSRECCRRVGWKLRLEPAPEKGTRAILTIPVSAEKCPGGTVALKSPGAGGQMQHYRLRSMLAREMRMMPEWNDVEE